MKSAAASAARGSGHSSTYALRDVEDLHDADLDKVLADRLAETYRPPTSSAAAVAQLVRRPGRAALLAHELSSRASMLLL
jgi:hypothetical protein